MTENNNNGNQTPPEILEKLYSTAQPEEQLRICNQRVKSVLYTPQVRRILEGMYKKGCVVPENFIQCKPCKPMGVQIGGFFSSDEGDINLAREQFKDFFIHELVHAYDYCRANIDPDDCDHVACTEIRASNLSGECKFVREAQRGYPFRWRNQQQNCVKRRAQMSLSNHPNCKDKAMQAVDRVFDRCYADVEPFDHMPSY